MKKLLQFCSLSLTIVMFASLCACNPQGEPYPSDEIMTSTPTQTSEPMVSIPEETKLPTEVPVDSTEPYIIDDENFEVYNEGDQLYHYIGQDQTVTVKDIGLEIHLPEEWVGQVEVIRNACPERTEIYIANIQLMQAYAEMNHDEIQESYGWLDGFYGYWQFGKTIRPRSKNLIRASIRSVWGRVKSTESTSRVQICTIWTAKHSSRAARI